MQKEQKEYSNQKQPFIPCCLKVRVKLPDSLFGEKLNSAHDDQQYKRLIYCTKHTMEGNIWELLSSLTLKQRKQITEQKLDGNGATVRQHFSLMFQNKDSSSMIDLQHVRHQFLKKYLSESPEIQLVCRQEAITETDTEEEEEVKNDSNSCKASKNKLKNAKQSTQEQLQEEEEPQEIKGESEEEGAQSEGERGTTQTQQDEGSGEKVDDALEDQIMASEENLVKKIAVKGKTAKEAVKKLALATGKTIKQSKAIYAKSQKLGSQKVADGQIKKEKKCVKFVRDPKQVEMVEKPLQQIDDNGEVEGKDYHISHYYRDISTNKILQSCSTFDSYDQFQEFTETLNNTQRKDYIEKKNKKLRGTKGCSNTLKSETVEQTEIRTNHIFEIKYVPGKQNLKIVCNNAGCRFILAFKCELNDQNEPIGITKCPTGYYTSHSFPIH